MLALQQGAGRNLRKTPFAEITAPAATATPPGKEHHAVTPLVVHHEGRRPREQLHFKF